MIISNIALNRSVKVTVESPVELNGTNPIDYEFSTNIASSINRFNKLTKLINVTAAIQQDRNYICKKFNHIVADFNKAILMEIQIDFNEQVFKLVYHNSYLNTKHCIWHKFNGNILSSPQLNTELELPLQ